MSYTASFSVRDGRYGLGTGPMIQNEYICDGMEPSFLNCSVGSSVSCSIGRSQSAAVRCEGECFLSLTHLFNFHNLHCFHYHFIRYIFLCLSFMWGGWCATDGGLWGCKILCERHSATRLGWAVCGGTVQKSVWQELGIRVSLSRLWRAWSVKIWWVYSVFETLLSECMHIC